MPSSGRSIAQYTGPDEKTSRESMTPERTAETESRYLAKARQLRSQAAKLHGYPFADAMPLTLIVDYVISRKTELARGSWRQYKNALRCYLEQVIELRDEKVVTEEALFAMRRLDEQSSTECLKKGTRTSALKQKTFKKDDFDRVITYLSSKIGKHRRARALAIWLQASRLTGLRPCEWESADFVYKDSVPVLVVRNGKATNGRGNGVERTLLLDQLTSEELDVVQDMIEMIEGYLTEIPFAQLQKLLGDYMGRVTRRCLGKRKQYPTLYSTRHQVSADAKSAGMTKAEVAALLGHASDETAGIHYARKVSGESALGVRPSVDDVRNVRSPKPEGPKDRLGR